MMDRYGRPMLLKQDERLPPDPHSQEGNAKDERDLEVIQAR
jgi:hypothetical protein